MSLEKRVAKWVDLGTTAYSETYDLQVKLANLRKKGLIGDVILTTEHHPEVNFGSAKEHNQFSDEFLKQVEESAGTSYTTEDIIKILRSKGLGFSETSRGGGATVIAPGQVIFYPIVDYEKIVGRSLGVGDYKNVIDRILYNVINQFNIPNLTIAEGLIETEQGLRDRRDVWTNINGKDFKIGSKGIKNSGNVAYHGFVVYATTEGVEPFSYVKPCGYSHDQVSVISIEEVTGDEVNKNIIKELTKEEIKRQFGYDRIEEVSVADFLSPIKQEVRV